ncbi:MAG: sulfatase [Gemmatimonadota bacterium]|nr:MAG: sulfatase [Gemmatimonadota bacterium]
MRKRSYRTLWSIVGPSALMASVLLSACGKEAPRPNVVLIYIDDLGWRDAGFMGSEYYETPHIDRLAAEGVVFTNAYANAPNCAPSRASLLTGQYTPRHGVYTSGSPERGAARLRRLVPAPSKTALDTGVVTIAEALKGVGYATAHVGKWHLGGHGYLPTDQGFDVNVAGDGRGHVPTHFHPYRRSENELRDLAGTGREGEYLTDRLTAEALGFIENHHDRPFFLYLSHYAVHTPLQAKDELVSKYRRKPGDDRHNHPVYAAMVASVDESVGRIVARLDEFGLSESTVVFFFSDNGGYGPATSMAPLRGSKGMLYEGGIRVPLVVRWPGNFAPGRQEATPVIGTDLFPTIIEIAGAEMPAQPLDGVSLLKLLQGAGGLEPRALHWHFPAYLEAYSGMTGPWRTAPAAAIRSGDYKLIESFETGELELYNLRDDIGERANLAAQLPDIVEELHQLTIEWRRSVGAPVPTELNPAYEGEN